MNKSVEQNSEPSPYDQLIEFGQEKGFLAIEDIALFFPDAKHDVGLLEEIFKELISAEIAYQDESAALESTDTELAIKTKEKTHLDEANAEENYLANIDTGDTIGMYLKEAGRVPLLTAEEEVSLAKRVESGRIAREEMANGNLTDEEKLIALENIEDGWIAREHLITANSRLVISVAKKYMGRGVPFQDLIQEGNIGLIRAAKKFDYHRGHKFSTYATWWIRQAVTRSIADQGRTIRIPVHMNDQINKMLRAQHKLTQLLGRNPSIEELARALDAPPRKVEHMIQVARRPLSLEMPVDDDEESVFGDFIKDKTSPDPHTEASQNILTNKIEQVLKILPPREARVLKLRFGLLDGQSHTLDEVGRKMGVTRERIRQIEGKALGRLRRPMYRRQLREYLDK